MTNVDEFWRELCAPFKVQLPLTFVEWLDKYFYLAPDATNADGRWVTLPYQKGLALLLTDLSVEKVNILKCAQIGFTQLLKALAGYECSHRNRTFCCWQPTSADSTRFSRKQIGTLLRDCPVVADAMRVDYRKKSPDNTIRERTFKAATLYNRGATSANEYRSISIATGVNDEISGMPAIVEDEGSPDSLAWSRMYAAAQPKLANGSTPTTAGECTITRLYLATREKFVRYYPCPCCEHSQPLVWGGAEDIEGMKFEKKYFDDGSLDFEATSKTAYYQCRACEHRMQYQELRDMDEKAQWRSKNFTIDDDKACFRSLQTGDIVEGPKEAAAHVTGMMSYTVSWEAGVYQFLKATYAAREGDYAELITWTNEYLGECFQHPEEKEQVSYEVLLNRATTNFSADAIPSKVICITAGYDIGQDHIAYEVVGWGAGEESWSLGCGKLMCDPASDDVIKDTLIAFGNKEYIRADDGNAMNIALHCVDSGYLTDDVYDACKVNPTRFIPVKGSSQAGKPVADFPRNKHKSKTYLTTVGTDTSKDILYSRYKIDTPGPGYCHFPIDGRPDTWYAELVSEFKKKVMKFNRMVLRWYLPKTRRAEALDCRVYALAAVRILQTHYGVNLDEGNTVSAIKASAGTAAKQSRAELIRSLAG